MFFPCIAWCQAMISSPLIQPQTPLTDAALLTMALLPTPQLSWVVHPDVFAGMSDAQFMRIATLLAWKSAQEGGCPIGAVVVHQATRQILGKGHNTLVQENHPYNHGETSAIRDAGRIDFGQTDLYTSLSPCDVCATLLYMRGVGRVVVGDVTNACGNEDMLRQKGVVVDILEDPEAVALYAKYRQAHPDLDTEDWRGKAALR